MAAAQDERMWKQRPPVAIRSTAWLNEAATRRGELGVEWLRTWMVLVVFFAGCFAKTG